MALWVGLVSVGGWLVLPDVRLDGLGEWQAASCLLSRISTLATGALAVILATGCYNAYRTMGGVTPFWSTNYGWVLSAKLVMMVLAAILGSYNRMTGFSAVSSAGSHRAVPLHALRRLV